jgi:hypothetical protein
MQHWAMTGLGLTLGLLAVCGTARGADATAPKEPSSADLDKAAALVKQLGDASFETRRDADKELAEMGRAAEKVLRDNLKNPDLEISHRCERLLALATRSDTEIALDAFLQNKDDKLLLKLPAWTRFSEMAGKDQSARMLFVDMYSSEGELLEALEKDPKNFAQKFNARCQQLQQVLWNPWGMQGTISQGQIVALLFAASDPRTNFDINSFYMISNFLYQPNVQQAFKADAGSRKILAAFIEKRATDQNVLQNVMQLVLQMEIKELVPVALKMATAKETQAYNKSTAILIVGRMGTKDDAEKLEPLLKDTTNLGAMMVGNTRIDAQLRDVALAAIIEANGQAPTDYGFPYLQANPQLLHNNYVAPNWYGFAKDADRDAAEKKFREWQKKQAKK